MTKKTPQPGAGSSLAPPGRGREADDARQDPTPSGPQREEGGGVRSGPPAARASKLTRRELDLLIKSVPGRQQRERPRSYCPGDTRSISTHSQGLPAEFRGFYNPKRRCRAGVTRTQPAHGTARTAKVRKGCKFPQRHAEKSGYFSKSSVA